MKINWCKILGHNWVPVFIKGVYNKRMIKFVGCYCQRCSKGEKEVNELNEIAINRQYGTYNERYFQ